MKARRRLFYRSMDVRYIQWAERCSGLAMSVGYCHTNNGVCEEALAFIETIGPDKVISVCENGDEVAVWYWSET